MCGMVGGVALETTTFHIYTICRVLVSSPLFISLLSILQSIHFGS